MAAEGQEGALTPVGRLGVMARSGDYSPGGGASTGRTGDTVRCACAGQAEAHVGGACGFAGGAQPPEESLEPPRGGRYTMRP
jgi:hypothetical protein